MSYTKRPQASLAPPSPSMSSSSASSSKRRFSSLLASCSALFSRKKSNASTSQCTPSGPRSLASRTSTQSNRSPPPSPSSRDEPFAPRRPARPEHGGVSYTYATPYPPRRSHSMRAPQAPQAQQAPSARRKREVLLRTIGHSSELPDHTLQGIRHILARQFPYVYVNRESLYINIDELPGDTVDDLYNWICGYQI